MAVSVALDLSVVVLKDADEWELARKSSLETQLVGFGTDSMHSRN